MRPTARRRDGTAFFWGTALGFLLTLGVVVANDLEWRFLPTAGASPEVTGTVAVPGRELFFPRTPPPGVHAFVYGVEAVGRPSGSGLAVTCPPGAERIALRSDRGILWSSRIVAATDTLRPDLGGELVVEVQRQARGGALFLDGIPAGKAPGSVEDVPAGWHMASVRDGEKILYQEGLFIHPGEITLLTVPPAPPHGMGRIRVASRILRDTGPTGTAGDAVAVDGEATGKTPIDLNLPAGLHSVSVDREGFPPFVEVLYVPAGQTRQVEADFGREDLLRIQVAMPETISAGRAAAIPVRVDALGESVRLAEGSLHLVRPGQAEPVDVPLVPSGSDPELWVAVLPAGLLDGRQILRGYASCRDDMDRSGASEIFTVPVR